MSMLTFFAEQRRRWFTQSKHWPSTHVDGGFSALLKAEVALQRQPMYNVNLRLLTVQRELDSMVHGHEQFCKLYGLRISQLAAAAQERREQIQAYKKLEKRAGQARRALSRLAAVADQEDFAPEVRLRYMQELMKQFFTQAGNQEAEDIPAE